MFASVGIRKDTVKFSAMLATFCLSSTLNVCKLSLINENDRENVGHE